MTSRAVTLEALRSGGSDGVDGYYTRRGQRCQSTLNYRSFELKRLSKYRNPFLEARGLPDHNGPLTLWSGTHR